MVKERWLTIRTTVFDLYLGDGQPPIRKKVKRGDFARTLGYTPQGFNKAWKRYQETGELSASFIRRCLAHLPDKAIVLFPDGLPSSELFVPSV